MLRECCARVGHHILHATLVHGNHVGVPLHHIHTFFLRNGLLRLEESVELPLLMIDLRVGRVHIFLLHPLRSRVEQSATEGHHPTAHVQPRKDHAPRIAVVQPLFALDAEPCLFQIFSLIAGLLGS